MTASIRSTNAGAFESDDLTRQRMSRIARRDTAPELALRRALHAEGWRFFVDRTVEGTRCRPDLSFPRLRVAVFVDGCFWHYCEAHTHLPRRNGDYWLDKLSGNRRRDAATTSRLEVAGWTVVRVWEHDPLDDAVRRVESELVMARRRRGVSHGPHRGSQAGTPAYSAASTSPSQAARVAAAEMGDSRSTSGL
ncbi:very short patch repair endonuclease [Frigoribacterium sp. PvP054]|uniref:very short patch repair endonuclease n=1 Tax=Frigoribacterium sp. PvP054 TaxID=3156438 RepID=UPI003398F880